MRKIILLVIILVFISFSPCLANDVSLDKAYTYYFQGNMPEAIKIMKKYVKEKPYARILYFIGYAYYEMKDMESARRYFEEAYLIDPDFTPLPPNKGGNG